MDGVFRLVRGVLGKKKKGRVSPRKGGKGGRGRAEDLRGEGEGGMESSFRE